MAELRIQPKKSAPSPWLLVGLAVLLLAAAAYFFLRPDPAATPAPAGATAPTAVPVDSLPPRSPAADARAAPPAAPDSAAAPASPPATGATLGLLQLGTDLVQLTNRADLRDDTTIREQRDNFTSATARLTEGDPRASLRPGLVAAANLLRAIQQKAYPALSTQADDLLGQASQLTGRNDTPAEQTQNSQYLTQATALLNALSQPASDAI